MSEFEPTRERGLPAPTSREILRARRKFAGVLRRLSPENQDFLSDMTSILNEDDIYNSYKSDPEKLNGFHKKLEGMELGENKIKTVFNFFNLPYEKK